MKKAIVYYSMSGNTEYVAKYIADRIDVDLIKIVPKKEYPSKGMIKFLWGGKSAIMGDTPALEEYSFDSNKYEYIVFGSPVWASCFTPPIRSFIKENKEGLKGKKFAAFICNMGGGADKALDKLRNYLEVSELSAELVLIEPKNNNSEENIKKIEEFVDKINN
jgi:flavodoxin